MAIIAKNYVFEAAHQLPGHKGKCADLHGHSYRVTVELTGDIQKMHIPPQSDDGFVMDFGDVSEFMKPLIAKYLDHKFLNDTLVSIRRTTAELIACWLFGAIIKLSEDRIGWGYGSTGWAGAVRRAPDDPRVILRRVLVEETATSVAEVSWLDWINAGQPGGEVSLD